MVRLYPPGNGPPHFHMVDQFQIFLPDEHATYLRSRIEHPLVHYSDAYSVYGPFATTGEFMEFFTLRAVKNSEIAFMPEERHRLRKRGKRNMHTPVDSSVVGADPPAGEAMTKMLFEPAEDHMSALFVTAGREAGIPTLSARDTSGRYYWVMSGELTFEGRTYGPLSLGWSTPGSEAPVLVAGEEGVRLVMLTFPYPSTELLDIDLVSSTVR
jgi:hypothetical protein